MTFWVYILKCSDGSYYVGHTDDLDNRIAEHQQGAIPGYTHDRRPIELLFSAEFPSRDEAFQRERQIKSWSRKKKEALISGDWANLKKAAKKRFPQKRNDPSISLPSGGTRDER